MKRLSTFIVTFAVATSLVASAALARPYQNKYQIMRIEQQTSSEKQSLKHVGKYQRENPQEVAKPTHKAKKPSFNKYERSNWTR
ncbi:MAG: hypothetical protein HYU97_10535 [Deltaproteobacteria bacterium]|nr:hypothetical protein [Deltaproteobacteria bacterium]